MIEFAVGILAGALFGYAMGGAFKKTNEREKLLRAREERIQKILGGGQ